MKINNQSLRARRVAAFAASSLAGALCLLGANQNAYALQPLSAFVASSKTRNFDQRQANLAITQKEADVELNTRKLWPTLGVKGIYTRNQYESAINTAFGGGPSQKITITPQNQWDAYFTVELPLINAARWRNISATDRALEASKQRALASVQDVELAVTQSYYQLLASRALVHSAQRSLETAKANLDVLSKRRAAGLALELDFQRGVSELERAQQILATAEYSSGQARRALSLASGLPPAPESETDAALLSDELQAPPSLAQYLGPYAGETPAITAARLEARSAELTESAAWLALVPTLTANGQERITNATGFAGHNASYQVSATLGWTLDASVASQAKAQTAALELARVKHEQATREQRDAVEDAHALVSSRLIEVRAARAEEASNNLSEKIANERYLAGTALQLESLTANREAFGARIARIQAEANLALARATLRIVSGSAARPQSPVAPSQKGIQP